MTKTVIIMHNYTVVFMMKQKNKLNIKDKKILDSVEKDITGFI